MMIRKSSPDFVAAMTVLRFGEGLWSVKTGSFHETCMRSTVRSQDQGPWILPILVARIDYHQDFAHWFPSCHAGSSSRPQFRPRRWRAPGSAGPPSLTPDCSEEHQALRTEPSRSLSSRASRLRCDDPVQNHYREHQKSTSGCFTILPSKMLLKMWHTTPCSAQVLGIIGISKIRLSWHL